MCITSYTNAAVASTDDDGVSHTAERSNYDAASPPLRRRRHHRYHLGHHNHRHHPRPRVHYYLFLCFNDRNRFWHTLYRSHAAAAAGAFLMFIAPPVYVEEGAGEDL